MDLKATASRLLTAAATLLSACVPGRGATDIPVHPRGGPQEGDGHPAKTEPAGVTPLPKPAPKEHHPSVPPLIAPPPAYGNKVVENAPEQPGEFQVAGVEQNNREGHARK